MANSVKFQMVSGDPAIFTGDDSSIAQELIVSNVQSVTVEGDPWVFFEYPNYRGNFVMYTEGKARPFPTDLINIQSVRRIKGGIDSSRVILYPNPFFEGHWESFQRKTPQLVDKYSSLKVTEGAVIFCDEVSYGGGKRILLNGDEVQNYAAVKLTSIGHSMMTARDMVEP